MLIDQGNILCSPKNESDFRVAFIFRKKSNTKIIKLLIEAIRMKAFNCINEYWGKELLMCPGQPLATALHFTDVLNNGRNIQA